jgi:transcriptional regulator with XRE-family HTH domain
MPPRRKVKPRSSDHAALGRAVEELRSEGGLTQEALADRLRIEATTVGKLERGLTNPTFVSLLKVARALDVELSEVFERFARIRRSAAGK